MIVTQRYELTRVDSLREHPENPRRGNVDDIAQSITDNGFYGAVVAQRSTGHVLVGNHRLMAARRQQLDELPVIWVECDDDRARRILLVDNRLNDRAGYDNDALAALLSTLDGSDLGLTGTGYSEDDLAALLPEFDPTDDAGARLDERQVCSCPNCGHVFAPEMRHPEQRE